MYRQLSSNYDSSPFDEQEHGGNYVRCRNCSSNNINFHEEKMALNMITVYTICKFQYESE